MLASITPLGERSRNSRWGTTVTAFVIGSTMAGSTAGAALGSIGVPLRTGAPASLRLWVLAAVVTIAVVYDARLFGLRLPTVRRQVNELWLNRYRGWVYGVGFGAQLGAGVATVVSTSAVYATLLAALLTGSPEWGGLAGGTFGLVRGLSVLPARKVRNAHALVALDAGLRRWERPSRVITGAMLAAFAATAAVGAVR
jgi:hypothetical protein